MAAENAWSASTQGVIMAAFFLGYLTLQIPAGMLADRFGGKWGIGTGCASLVSIYSFNTSSSGNRAHRISGMPPFLWGLPKR